MAQLMSIKRNVEMCPGQVSVPAIYHVSQGDKGTRIILGLVNNSTNYTIPEGTTAIIRGSRSDGTLFEEITADVETTEVKFNLTEDMTSIPGAVECEAVLSSGTANVVGTANFIIDVERSPASIGSVIPGTDAATAWLIDKLENESINALNDESVVDAINGDSGSGLTEDIKTALLACFENVAWINEDGQDYYDALYNALYPPPELVSISAVYTQPGAVYDTDALDSLRANLVVTAYFTNSTTEIVTSYTLSGSLTSGVSTITVSYGGKTATFNVMVTHYDNSLYSWDFTQSLVDSKQGAVAEVGTGITRDSNGLTFDGTTNSWCKLVNMSAYKSTSYTVEMDVTAITQPASQSPVVIGVATTSEGSSSDDGIRITSSGTWRFKDTSNSFKNPSQVVTGADYFNNSTLKFVLNYSGQTWSVYKDGVLAFNFNPTYATSNNRNVVTIGTSKTNEVLGSGTIIKALRIFAGVV